MNITDLNAGNTGVQYAGYLCFGASGGYSTMFGKTPSMSVPGSFNIGGHIGGENRWNNFIFRWTGEFQWFNSESNTDITVNDAIFLDTRLTEATMHYEMLSPLNEKQKLGIASGTFMVGYSWSNMSIGGNSGPYLLAGVKLGCSFDLGSTLNLKYRTSATYDRYIDDYADMSNHYYSKYEKEDPFKFDTRFNLMIPLEAGWEIVVGDCHRLKIGAFADFGLTEPLKSESGETADVCKPNQDNVSDLKLSTQYQSSEMEKVYVTPFMVGAKVTLLINLTKHKKGCHGCKKCYRNM